MTMNVFFYKSLIQGLWVTVRCLFWEVISL